MTEDGFTDEERRFMDKNGLLYDAFSRKTVPKPRCSEVMVYLKGDDMDVKGRTRRFATPEEAEKFANMLMTATDRFVLWEEWHNPDCNLPVKDYFRTDEIVMVRVCHGVI